jgi:NADPH:quinone reductase-like Zn-dependent oxidoreductase
MGVRQMSLLSRASVCRNPPTKSFLCAYTLPASVRWDALVGSGKIGLPLTLRLTLGSEFSGAVEKVGAKTTGFAVADEIFGATNPRFIDGYAEYAVAAATPKPRELSHIEAASVPVIAVTASQMLFDHAKVLEIRG